MAFYRTLIIPFHSNPFPSRFPFHVAFAWHHGSSHLLLNTLTSFRYLMHPPRAGLHENNACCHMASTASICKSVVMHKLQLATALTHKMSPSEAFGLKAGQACKSTSTAA